MGTVCVCSDSDKDTTTRTPPRNTQNSILERLESLEKPLLEQDKICYQALAFEEDKISSKRNVNLEHTDALLQNKLSKPVQEIVKLNQTKDNYNEIANESANETKHLNTIIQKNQQTDLKPNCDESKNAIIENTPSEKLGDITIKYKEKPVSDIKENAVIKQDTNGKLQVNQIKCDKTNINEQLMENMMNINLNDLSVFNICQWVSLLPIYKQYLSSVELQKESNSTSTNIYLEPNTNDIQICKKLSSFLYENQINGKTLNTYKNIDYFNDMINCLCLQEYNRKYIDNQYQWIFECIVRCKANCNSIEWVDNSWTEFIIKFENNVNECVIVCQ